MMMRSAVRDLTEATQGQAAGIGFADFSTRRLVEKIDHAALYTNALTASAPEEARIPLTLESDREMILAALGTSGPVPPFVDTRVTAPSAARSRPHPPVAIPTPLTRARPPNRQMTFILQQSTPRKIV
jgi:hypothetical protein